MTPPTPFYNPSGDSVAIRVDIDNDSLRQSDYGHHVLLAISDYIQIVERINNLEKQVIRLDKNNYDPRNQ